MPQSRVISEGTFFPLHWDAPPVPAPPRRIRGKRAAFATAALIAGLGAAVAVLAYLAVRNDSSAQSWKRLYQKEAIQLRAANSRAAAADQQQAALQQQVSSLTDQKAAAVGDAATLQQLLSSAATVADDLQQCITATDQLDTDIGSVLLPTPKKVAALQDELSHVQSTCDRAEAANSALQTSIKNAP